MPCMPQPLPDISIRLFGSLDVRIGNEPLPRLHSQRGLWLLALLTLRGGVQMDRSYLAGMLWPESPEPTALHNLRQTLADLRRALGPAARCLVSDTPRTLRLDISHIVSDVLEFDSTQALNGDVIALERAASLYNGPLLAGCDEPWAIEERERRDQAYLDILEQLAAACAAARDYTGASRWHRLAVSSDPYRESAHRGLMEALAATGELTASIEVYRTLRARLHRDLNAEPDPLTSEVFREIRGRRPPVSPEVSQALIAPRARSVQVPATQLIGRDQDVLEILDLLRRVRLITITGVGGIGKTRLALQIAKEIEEGCEDEAIFVGLAALTNSAAVTEAVREALGVATADARQEPIDSLKRHLQSRHTLLILDNCEHLVSACAAMADDLLNHCEHVRIVATSRHALGLASETVWRVPSLELPPSVLIDDVTDVDAVNGLQSYAAVKLFAERARSVEPSFRLTTASARLIVEVCRHLDGIPLAIELAAARVRSLSLDDIHCRLQSGLKLLSNGGPALVPRHHTLEAAFQWSWDLLTSKEQTLLRRLAVFSGGWTLNAAEAVCSGGEVAKDEIVDVLTALVDNSLVIFDLNAGATDTISECQARYHLLEPIRQFASDRLDASAEREALSIRHRDFFLHLSEEIRPRLSGEGQEMWFDRLEADHDNMRSAIRLSHSRDADAEEELRLVVALARLWDTHGHLREGREHLDAALSRVTSDAPLELKANALIHAGWSAYVQRDGSAARKHYGLALSTLEASGNQQRRAEALGLLALVVSDDGDLYSARLLLEESLSIRRSLGSDRLASILNNLAWISLQLDDDAAARAYLDESLIFCERIVNTPQQMAITLCNLAEVDLRQGQYESAEAQCCRSIRISRDCGAIVNIPDALDRMAQISSSRECWEKSARLLGAAEELRATMGVPLRGSHHADAMLAAESALGLEIFDAALGAGRRMKMDQAIMYALGETQHLT